MVNSVVLYELKDKIAFITLNRPEKRNAVDDELCIELAKAWKRFEHDENALVAILSGAGKCFSSGRDQTGSATDAKAYEEATRANGVTVFKPIIGAVHGYALGSGYALASKACDLTIAAEGTKFGYPESRVGMAGAVPYIPMMPLKKSLEFMFLAVNPNDWIDAQVAYEWGLVNKVVPEAELMTEAIKWAEKIKLVAPLSLRAIKYGHYRAVGRLAGEAQSVAIEQEYVFEQFMRPQLESEDREEGRRAFQEKREPIFKGK